MTTDSSDDSAGLKAENRLLRDTLVWIARNSLDAAVRVRAKDVLRRIDPSAALEGDRNEAEIYGEWCI